MNKQNIIKDIEEYVGKSNYSGWYVGITNDIDRRLFGEHNVDREKDYWIYRTANSKAIAQEIEEYFLDKGMDGDTGGGSDDTTKVYVYKKNWHTNP